MWHDCRLTTHQPSSGSRPAHPNPPPKPGRTHIHLPHPATPAESQMYWPQVAGSVILMSGVVFTYVLEIWRRYKLSKRKRQEQAQLVEMLEQDQEGSYWSETFV